VTAAEGRLVEQRALQSRGESGEAIYAAAAAALRSAGARGTIVDVGCGTGRFRRYVDGLFTTYIGIDVIRHDGLPGDVTFLPADLDHDPLPLADGAADCAAAIETIEHLENPRAFCREMARILRPGGMLVVTTPNQVSLLSLLSLVARQQFDAFTDLSYPAHRTALLPVDLRRIAAESGLAQIDVRFTSRGRIPLTRVHYPTVLSRVFPRALSDNVVLVARRQDV
jgi:2-polyprenyl-3-methyl-5-hydroxy-6-metoxy-1,4-benzoquinol methylase